MKIASVVLIVSTFCCRSGPPTYAYQHGTVVTTLAVRDGFVMAADGQSVWQSGADAQPFQGVRTPAEPKIAICGRVFLCGMAGLNPLPLGKAGLEYHFQQWISAIADHASSPEEFTKAIEREAKRTFQDMGTVFKKDPFWKSPAAPDVLLEFTIAGYAGDQPQVCLIVIETDLQNSALNYPDPVCNTPEWRLSSSTASVRYDLSVPTDAAFIAGTPEAAFFQEARPRALATVRALRPDTSEALQQTIASAAALIRVVDKFQPDLSGGSTTVGVLQKGKLPEIFQFPDF